MTATIIRAPSDEPPCASAPDEAKALLMILIAGAATSVSPPLPNMGSSHFSKLFHPPNIWGQPIHPPTIDSSASIIRGMVMTFGDS